MNWFLMQAISPESNIDEKDTGLSPPSLPVKGQEN